MLAFAEMPPTPTKPAPATGPRAGWWPLLAGLFLAFVLLKLGNPVILDHIAGVPEGWEEIIFETWPVAWGYCVLAVVTVVGALQWRRGLARQSGRWCSRGLARVAVRRGDDDGGCLVDQGGAAAVCRDGGLFRGGPERGAFRRGATGLAGFARGIAVGAGLRIPAAIRGLAASREFFYENEKTGWKDVPPEELARLEASRLLVRRPDGILTINPNLLPKLAKDRIMGTLVQPNALAGVVLLLLPGALLTVWSASGGCKT